MKHNSEADFLPLQIRVGTESFHLWLHVDPVLFSLSGIFRSIFRARLFNASLIDCDLDQWLATTGLLSQYWIYSMSLPPLAWTASFLCLGPKEVFINEVQLQLLCLQSLPDPVNVLSVSWCSDTHLAWKWRVTKLLLSDFYAGVQYRNFKGCLNYN